MHFLEILFELLGVDFMRLWHSADRRTIALAIAAFIVLVIGGVFLAAYANAANGMS